MNHCTICHRDFEKYFAHQKECILTEECNKCPSKKLKEFGDFIAEEARRRGEMQVVEGVFGDATRNKGYVEKYVPDDERGIQTKFYGCKELYKGKIRSDTIDAGVPLKAILMAGTKQLLANKFILILISPVFLLFWKRILNSFVYWFAEIYEKDLKQKTLTNIRQFSPTTRELIRAGFKCAEEIPVKGDISFLYEGVWHAGEKDELEYQVRTRRCIWAVATFIQADSAYYWRVQDPLSNLNKENVKRNVRKELLRLFDLALSREKQIPHKIGQLRKLIALLLLFPPFAKYARIYLSELDVTKFQPDEADRYFAYRRSCYDFEGKSWEERLKWAKEIDKRDENVIIET